MGLRGKQASYYLICSNDKLQTAFFCGTAEECVGVLGMKNKSVFFCAISKGTKVFDRFAHIERVKLEAE